MLISKEVVVKRKNNYNLDWYASLGYDVDQDYFIVKIEHLLKNSFCNVQVSCDYCGNLERIPYYKWNRSMESAVKKYSCKNCKGEKIKESNLIKYGVTSVAKLDSSKEKSKKTNLEKFGVEFHTQSKSVKEKIKSKNLETYGFDNPMKSPQIKEKKLNTTIQNWGVDNISKIDQIKDKKKQTTLSNYGVEYPLRSEEIKNRVKITNLKKYGAEYFTKSESWRKENYDIAADKFYLNYLEGGISQFICDYGEHHEFQITKDVYSKRKLYGVGLCTICNPIDDNISIKEKDLYRFISSIYSDEIIQTCRIGKMEIDIYLPNLNLGFEFNGLWWHSEKYKDSKFHLNKTEFFKERGIRIIHIWEDDWDNRGEIVRSQISNILGKTEKRIFARNCYVREVSLKESKDFLKANHIQGSVNSVVKLGLYYENDLVSLMTFDHFEGRKKMEHGSWNLSRFCNKIGITVAGGASKLFSYFIKNYDVKRVVSYADLDWSVGSLYYKLGFSLVSQTAPDYKYIFEGKRLHKGRFRKSITGVSESKLGVLKIWNCGKLKFEYILT